MDEQTEVQKDLDRELKEQQKVQDNFFGKGSEKIGERKNNK